MILACSKYALYTTYTRRIHDASRTYFTVPRGLYPGLQTHGLLAESYYVLLIKFYAFQDLDGIAKRYTKTKAGIRLFRLIT